MGKAVATYDPEAEAGRSLSLRSVWSAEFWDTQGYRKGKKKKRKRQNELSLGTSLTAA